MKILVCGGRDFDKKSLLFRVLDKALEKYGSVTIIQGGARGADRLAKEWAISRNQEQLEFKANWNALGKKAGIVRNQEMLEQGQPGLVIAFEGGTGTEDMVRRSERAGVKVVKAFW